MELRREDPPPRGPEAETTHAGSATPASFVVGDLLCDRFRVVRFIARGGMGELYEAEDIALGEHVALKTIRPEIASDEPTNRRFRREVQLARKVTHPNICRIFDLFQHQPAVASRGSPPPVTFVTMELLQGETLAQRLRREGPVTAERALPVVAQMTAALSAAHAVGIVHRDFKSNNVMLLDAASVGDLPRVVVTDFGLAYSLSDSTVAGAAISVTGDVVGTPDYMAPEQLEGTPVTPATDIYALGIVMYEMVTGELPFAADTPIASAMRRIVGPPPKPPREVVPDLPVAWDRAIMRCLARYADDRFSEPGAVAKALDPEPRAAAAPDLSARRRWVVAAAVLLLTIVVPFGWFVRQGSQARWAREQALPEIERLVEQEQYFAAFGLANEAKRYIATDPIWNRLDPIISRPLSVKTTPPGAAISYREYASPNGQWTSIGESPVANVRIPNAVLAWKVEKQGFSTEEDVSANFIQQLTFTLHEAGSGPPGMVHVTVGDALYRLFIPGLDNLPAVKLKDYWIDRREVTNREFKRFVDAGGYRDSAFWQHPFTRGDRSLTFGQVIGQFTDSTGRPGPATWELGSFPEGQDDFPVTGVSWYEAAAFAAYSGKSLPTVYHWSHVAEQRLSGTVLPRSNFSGRAVLKAGASGAINRFGAVDMAGNVKEWTWNRSDASRRYILGGAWDEPIYMANDPDARSPFERASNFGFRCVKYSPDELLVNAGAELVAFEARDFAKETPVNDQAFDLYRRLYAYDKSDLKAAVESVDESNAEWRREKVSFAAAYGKERVPAFLFAPKGVNPPYQAVVYFPGAASIQQRSSSQINTRAFDWIMKSGRAVIYPIYKGTFERGYDSYSTDYPNPSNTFRDHVLEWAKDVRRAIDYLETRPDIARDRMAYMGASWGAAMGPIYCAVEPRFKACLLIVGGFYLQHSAPEVDAFNFAPRVKVPVLLLNGRFDFFFPVDTSQLPMFRLFGVPEAQKRRVVYDTGHNIPRPDLVRETLDWLDRYLGPAR